MTAFLLAAIVGFEDTPEGTVEAFVKAFNAHDCPGLAHRVIGGKLDAALLFKNAPTLKSKVSTASLDGDEARLVVDIVAEPARAENAKSRETVTLRWVNGDWRIVPPNPKSFEGSERQEYVSAISYAVVHPEKFRPKPRDAATVGLQHIRLIAIATMMYAEDHHGTLPLSSHLGRDLAPYLPDAGSRLLPTGTVGYFLDPRLSGKRLDRIAHPEATALILRGTPTKVLFPYGGETPVGYADGHGKMVAPSIVSRARAISLK